MGKGTRSPNPQPFEPDQTRSQILGQSKRLQGQISLILLLVVIACTKDAHGQCVLIPRRWRSGSPSIAIESRAPSEWRRSPVRRCGSTRWHMQKAVVRWWNGCDTGASGH